MFPVISQIENQLPTRRTDRMELKRLKKQNMERIRRAKISDQITQLHNIALSLVGKENVNKSALRTEKVEMLSFCQEVLNSMVYLLNERPEIKKRLNSFYKKNSANMNNQNCQDLSSSPFNLCDDSGVQKSSSTSGYPIENSKSRHTDSILPPKKRQLWRPYL